MNGNVAYVKNIYGRHISWTRPRLVLRVITVSLFAICRFLPDSPFFCVLRLHVYDRVLYDYYVELKPIVGRLSANSRSTVFNYFIFYYILRFLRNSEDNRSFFKFIKEHFQIRCKDFGILDSYPMRYLNSMFLW